MMMSMTSCSGKVVLKQALRDIRRISLSSESCHGVIGRRCGGVSNPPSSGSRNSVSCRCFSADSFSSYIYPNRTEAPIVTRTTAKEAASFAAEEEADSDSSHRSGRSRRSETGVDRFDDEGALSLSERSSILESQKRESATLKGATAITKTVAPHIPPNVPSRELVVPTTEITTLDNGVRVVSQETYGQVTTIGVVADVGSRHEFRPDQDLNSNSNSNSELELDQTGVAHLLDFLAFSGSTRSAEYSSALSITQLLQDWGGTRFVNYGREQTIHCVDVLRPNVQKAMDLLQATYLHPKFDVLDIEDAIKTIEFQAFDMPQELLLEEAIQRAAYGQDQQLGKQHFCPPEQLPYLLSNGQQLVADFWHHHILNNPEGLVISGAGIQHDQLVQMAQQHFGSLTQQSQPSQQVSSSRTIPSIYRGGDHFVEKSPPGGTSGDAGGTSSAAPPPAGAMISPDDGMVRVAVAFELEGGWHSQDLVPTCVLQTLLGGGNSFSAGGPGKGMYSRLYRQVLNRYSWVESCEAFTSIHNESGLWGISGSCSSHDYKKIQDFVQILCENILKLTLEHVTEEEISRARNMLKCNVLTQLESRLVLFEDLGRQVLTYGFREDIATTCKKIDAVTKQQLLSLVQRAVQNKPPTIAAVGENLQYVPRQQEVARWFGSSS